MNKGNPIIPFIPQDIAGAQLISDLANMATAITETEKIMAVQKKQIEALERKKRRRATRKELSSNERGEIFLVTRYDDGTSERQEFITNVRGQMSLALLSPTDCGVSSQLVLIMVGHIPVVGFLDKMRHGRYIYRQMLAACVEFNLEISRSLIEDVLEKWFWKNQNKAGRISTQFLSGWRLDDDRGSFMTNTPLSFSPTIARECGIRETNFEEIPLTKEIRDGYVSEICQIKEKEVRQMIFIEPFLGLLYGLIRKYMGGLTVYVNLVAASEVSIDWISSWLQVFDRSMLSDGSIRQSNKERERWLEQLNDEVLILDVRRFVGETEYFGKKKKQFLASMADMVKNQRYIPGTQKKLSAVLVSVSDELEDGCAINVVLPDFSEMDRKAHEKFLAGKYLEAVMTAVVSYIESNFSKVVQILRRERGGNMNQNIFEAVMEVLVMFFQEEGMDLISILQIDKDFNSYFENLEEENPAQVFVQTVRMNIGSYRARSKLDKNYEEHIIFYDEDYLFFPRGVLEEMYRKAYRGNQWKKALIQLRTEGYMETSSPDNLVKKLQVGGVRRDFYAVKREIFNQPGYAEIVKLARCEDGK